MARMEGLIERTSLPAMSGADISAHRPMWVRYSVSVMPPFPISSMSGSFDVPGRVASARRRADRGVDPVSKALGVDVIPDRLHSAREFRRVVREVAVAVA